MRRGRYQPRKGLLTQKVFNSRRRSFMRRYVRLAAFVALLAAFPGVANANAL
jgi:hypothetical protein